MRGERHQSIEIAIAGDMAGSKQRYINSEKKKKIISEKTGASWHISIDNKQA